MGVSFGQRILGYNVGNHRNLLRFRNEWNSSSFILLPIIRKKLRSSGKILRLFRTLNPNYIFLVKFFGLLGIGGIKVFLD